MERPSIALAIGLEERLGDKNAKEEVPACPDGNKKPHHREDDYARRRQANL
jgi:hypothetical protein